MDEVHYLISDASRKVDVEAHVLRYWEEELELAIPRNEMGHRYYTDFHIRLFKQVKNLKEKGYQLKAIKHALEQIKKDGKLEGELTDEILEQDMDAALKELKEEEKEENTAMVSTSADGSPLPVSAEEKMAQFQQMMNLIIGRALEVNNEKLREQNYKEAVRANDPEALVAIIKMIYQRKQKRLAQGKKCTATDARYFQIAENLLYMELGVALGKPKQEICKTIIDYINQNKID